MKSISIKFKNFVNKLNEKGIPVPLICLNGNPTFTGTLSIISFTSALLGQIGKVTNLIGDVDLTQANYLFLICLGAYLGRRVQNDGKGLDAKSEEDSK